MTRHFNTTGHNLPTEHYSVDPFARITWSKLQRLIDAKKFFVVHAPRQSGKTTLLEAIVQRLNAEGHYAAMRMSVHSVQTAGSEWEKGIRTVADRLVLEAEDSFPDSWLSREGPALVKTGSPGNLLMRMLRKWAATSEKPIVLLVDEIDALVGDTLVSVLTQLRDGYIGRPKPFPQSVILCGVRDVREYRIHTSKGEIIAGGSCFNVKAESLRLGNFIEDEVHELYSQHTAETGQGFDGSIHSKVMALTGGQPWLVNALARELTLNMPELRDRTRTITPDDVDEAKEQLILRRDVHIDQLVDKLKEPRVRRVIEPILSSGEWAGYASEEDRMYAMDLGLVVEDREGGPRIANEIYREVIPRVLTSTFQRDLEGQVRGKPYVLPDGRLEFRKMLEGFQQFYRANADILRDLDLYGQATTQLILQAWLQRVVNSGGLIEREYALGTGRADLFVRHFHQENGGRGEQRFVLEIKVVRSRRSVETTIQEGLVQTAEYADRCNPEEAHLVVIDPRERSWDEKIYVRECVAPVLEGSSCQSGRAITVWGV